MNILERIIVVKKEEVKKLKKSLSVEAFTQFEFYNDQCLSFSDALTKKDKISIIAEIKKASPSKGIIRPDFDHEDIANIYMDSQVDAISILTDEMFFQGNIEYLNSIAFIKTVPLLRKDFIIDEIQIHQAKAYGADAILLISEVLDKTQIRDYSQIAKELDLAVLLEMHSPKMLDKIDQSLNTILGVNNRNLEDFSVDLNTTGTIKKYINDDVIVVSESGIATQEDIQQLQQIGADAILVGETFIKSDDMYATIRQMQKWCSREN